MGRYYEAQAGSTEVAEEKEEGTRELEFLGISPRWPAAVH